PFVVGTNSACLYGTVAEELAEACDTRAGTATCPVSIPSVCIPWRGNRVSGGGTLKTLGFTQCIPVHLVKANVVTICVFTDATVTACFMKAESLQKGKVVAARAARINRARRDGNRRRGHHYATCGRFR